MSKLSEDLGMVPHVIHSVFLYAACTEAGFVKIGISRTPFDRVYQIHVGSPSPVRAVQWVWIGSMFIAKAIEKRIREEWDQRHTRGEWYRFDYSNPLDKADFHDTLSAVVEVMTGRKPAWERLGADRVKALIAAGNTVRLDKERAAQKKKVA